MPNLLVRLNDHAPKIGMSVDAPRNVVLGVNVTHSEVSRYEGICRVENIAGIPIKNRHTHESVAGEGFLIHHEGCRGLTKCPAGIQPAKVGFFSRFANESHRW